jgi:hypothetical protein
MEYDNDSSIFGPFIPQNIFFASKALKSSLKKVTRSFHVRAAFASKRCEEGLVCLAPDNDALGSPGNAIPLR